MTLRKLLSESYFKKKEYGTMKKAKKVLAMALVLTMTLSLVACGSNPAASTSVASSDPAVSSAPVEESTYPNDTISFIKMCIRDRSSKAAVAFRLPHTQTAPIK